LGTAGIEMPYPLVGNGAVYTRADLKSLLRKNFQAGIRRCAEAPKRHATLLKWAYASRYVHDSNSALAELQLNRSTALGDFHSWEQSADSFYVRMWYDDLCRSQSRKNIDGKLVLQI
jgi:hypothetical protein